MEYALKLVFTGIHVRRIILSFIVAFSRSPLYTPKKRVRRRGRAITKKKKNRGGIRKKKTKKKGRKIEQIDFSRRDPATRGNDREVQKDNKALSR